MQIASWNVNSVRARLNRLLPWLDQHQPEIVCLQETKVVDELFPREPIADLGYNIETFGQKTYNGVALLSREPIEAVVRGFPDDGEDAQRRLIGGVIGDFVVLNLYVPNGSAISSDKYRFKLDWLAQLRQLLDTGYDVTEKLVITGDFNITFDDRDVHDPELWRDKIHCSAPEREAPAMLMDFGLHDALRAHHSEAGIHTWWDHRGGAFHRGFGLRIDHFLMTEAALQCCTAVTVDRDSRKGKQPSDHAPVIAEFGG